MYDLQKASVLKRFSAWLLDAILLSILVVGVAGGLFALVDYDGYAQSLEAYYASYENQYGVEFDLTEEEYNAMTERELAQYQAAYEALIADDDAMYVYNMTVNLIMMILPLSFLLAYLVLEFAVPLYLKNGQTVGKKAFGIALMRTHGVKINGVCLFIRTVLGKYTVETMIPVFIIMMLMFNMTGLVGTLVIMALGIAQIVLLCVTRTNSAIHDLLADTVAVDMSSQMIFASEEDLLEYKKRVSAEEAAKQSYF